MFASTVLDGVFDRLDREAMTHALTLKPEDKNEQILNLFFLSERAYFDKEPHAYQSYLNQAEKICRTAEADLACALVFSELSISATGFSRLSYQEKAKACLAVGRKNADPNEVFYVEGRVLLALAESLDPHFGKSLLDFQMLLRTRPELKAPSFWILHEYKLSGNEKAFQENLSSIAKQDNIRTKLLYGEEEGTKEFLGGFGYGARFGLYATQLDGFGAAYNVWDDRIFDKNRKASILLKASTQKNFGLGADYEDGELLSGTTLGMGTSLEYRTDEYYGDGVASLKSDRSIFRDQSANFHFEFKQKIVSHLNFSVGWAFYQRHLRELIEGPFANVTALTGENIFYSGGYFSLVFRTLESGIRLKGYFPTKDFMSSHTFQKWSLDSELSTSISSFRLTGRAASSIVSQEAPFDAYVEAKTDLNLPGIRESRYRDFHLTGASIELKHKLFGPFLLGVYSTTLLSAFDFNSTKLGFGGLVELYLTRFRKKQARIEVGSFNGEFIFGLDLGFGL